MPSSNAQRIGTIAEYKFIVACLERDFEPHLSITPMPWDCLLACPAGDLRVQVKSTSFRKGQSYNVVTSSGCTGKSELSSDVDVVACYVSPEDTWWMIPRDELTSKSIKLNPEPDSKSKYKKYQENWSIYYK